MKVGLEILKLIGNAIGTGTAQLIIWLASVLERRK